MAFKCASAAINDSIDWTILVECKDDQTLALPRSQDHHHQHLVWTDRHLMCREPCPQTSNSSGKFNMKYYLN